MAGFFIIFISMLMFLFPILFTTHTLTVTVMGVEKAQGQLVVAIYDSEETFMDGHNLYDYRFVTVEKSGEVSFHLHLPEGQYAVSVYQDLNGDKKLNRNFIGLPREPYGFSNNVRAVFVAPMFSAVALRLDRDRITYIQLN